LDRRSAALEGEVHGVQPRAPVDLLADEEAQRADAGRREVDAAGLRPGRAYEFAQVLSPGGRVRAYDQSEAREQGDRGEIAKGVVGQLFERDGVDRMRREREQQRVAVGLRLGDGAR